MPTLPTIHVGDEYRVERSMGNGKTRTETWKVLTSNRRGAAVLEVSFIQNEIARTLVRQEKVAIQVLWSWCHKGLRITVGRGVSIP